MQTIKTLNLVPVILTIVSIILSVFNVCLLSLQKGWTPLHWASSREVVQLLLAAGVNKEAVTDVSLFTCIVSYITVLSLSFTL